MNALEIEIKDIVLDQIGTNKKNSKRLEQLSTIFRKDTEFSEIGIGSLDSVELTMTIEDKYSIHIPDEIMDNLNTITKVVQYIENYKNVHH